MLVHFESKSKNGTKTIYKGTLKINPSGGALTCKIIYDSQSGSYSGELINERFSASEWHSCGLDAGKAKEYYDNLREQDPDQKKRID
ncbi:MAG: hypothetical protein AMXMBFR12_09070 [Candidatus Babeliales bacterium]